MHGFFGKEERKIMITSKKERRLLILTGFLYILNAIMTTMTTYSISKVMECAETGAVEKLPIAILIAIGILVAEKISSIGMTASNLWYVSIGDLTLKRKIMKNIFERPLQIFRKKENAYYINLLTNDVAMYREQCLGSYPWICFFIAYGLFSIIMLCTFSPLLAVATVILSIIPFLFEKKISEIVQKYNVECSEKGEKHINILTETMEGYESICLDNGKSSFYNRYNEASTMARIAAAKMSFANSVSQEVLYTSASILRIVALVIGAVLVVKGHMKAAMLFAAMNYATSISNSFSNISSYVISIRSTKEIAKKLKEECEYDCDVKKIEKIEKMDIVPIIEYKKVSFQFDNKLLYHNFSQRFCPGGCYAIIGESGSGKSTLMKLFLKYYDTYSGSILFNGKDIRKLSEEDIYEQVGIINQTPWIFNASLYENITMCTGNPARNTKEYEKLLSSLNLRNLAERVGDEPLGDFGDKISGGERQRISLARALRNNVKILIFDEPTTGLDPENAQIINEFIFQQKKITRIVISHDWSEEYLKQFDEIIKI